MFNYKVERSFNSFEGVNPDIVNAVATSTRDVGIHMFPNDLAGNNRKSAHFMQININENNVAGSGSDSSERTKEQIKNNAVQYLPEDQQKLAQSDLAQSIKGINEYVDYAASKVRGVDSLFGSQQLNNYSRIKGAILLYMPVTNVYTDRHDYEESSITSLVAEATSGITPGILRKTLDIGAKVSSYQGLPINPKIEVLFKNTSLRSFQFDFMLAPTTAQETQTIHDIIKILRTEAAPSKSSTVSGFVWKAPSTFNISFWHNGQENAALPKLKECFLEQVDADFAPTGGWATFKNGYPVAVRLQLRFRERLPISREDVEQGY